MSFEENIKEWVRLDNDIKSLNDKMRVLRDSKNEITGEIVTYASEKNLTHKIIEITDGNLKFQTRKETSPLTFKLVKECLTDCITNEEQVDKLINYIKEKRSIKYVDDVKRSYNS